MNAAASRRVALAALAGMVATLAIPISHSMRTEACARPWVFFDLGNTIVMSAPGVPAQYAPGAHAYLRELRRRGFPVGLITNIPEKWGNTRAEKVRALKDFIAETWTKDPSVEAMEWGDFPDAVILIPFHDVERKPDPFLFRSATALVKLAEGDSGCPIVYQGEDPAEIEAARKEGLIGYRVFADPAAPFMPIERIGHP